MSIPCLLIVTIKLFQEKGVGDTSVRVTLTLLLKLDLSLLNFTVKLKIDVQNFKSPKFHNRP